MLKNNRLRKNHQFQSIINGKKSLVSKSLVVYYSKNNKEISRFGISISKKFVNAVNRNKLRRQVRAILDEISPYGLGLDFVLILRKPFIKSEFNAKKESLKKILLGKEINNVIRK